MSKKDLKNYNDKLLCYAILILTTGLVGGSFFIAVGMRCDSLNAIGGALFEDVASSMYVAGKNVPLVNYVYGIGGRDTTEKEISSVYDDLSIIAKDGKVENPYRYLGLRREEK